MKKLFLFIAATQLVACSSQPEQKKPVTAAQQVKQQDVAQAKPAQQNVQLSEREAQEVYQHAMDFLDRKNHNVAFSLMQKSANAGHAKAQFELGRMYRFGQGVTQDDSQAVYWYRKAAELGNADGQTHLGFMYDNGYGIAQDYAQAVYWYRKAAEQGHALGQHNLAGMYINALGVPKDYARAAFWYTMAAEQGRADSQVELGFMYENGRGVAQDYAQAVYWYRKAAEQGHALGQANLGHMYANGYGVTQDTVIALAWSILGSEESDVGRSNRNLLSQLVNDKQRAEAGRLAANWRVGTSLPERSKTWR